MKIVIAPDSFKGALSSAEVCEALKKGWLERRPQDEVLLFPLADGGEGTCDALVRSTNGKFLDVETVQMVGDPDPDHLVFTADDCHIQSFCHQRQCRKTQF